MERTAVFYEMGGWNYTHVPEEGSLVLYPSGLLNINDRQGRTVGVSHGVVAVATSPAAPDAEDRIIALHNILFPEQAVPRTAEPTVSIER